MRAPRIPNNAARWPYVIAFGAMTALGGGYAVHETYINTDTAALIAHQRDRVEDCLQHQIDDLKGRKDVR